MTKTIRFYTIFSLCILTLAYAGSTVAYDINNDGYGDIVFSSFSDGSTYSLNSYIYWGSASGMSTSNRTELPTLGAMDNSVADLNSDGYLDVIFSNFIDGSTGAINSYIYWGSASGMSTSNRTELPTVGAMGNSVADLNSDGYLDIVFSSFKNGSNFDLNSYVYYGSASGFTSAPVELSTHGAIGNAIADFNGDGNPDIVFSNFYNGSSKTINSYVYWGSESGIITTNPTELATVGSRNNSVADLNDDGYMDIVFSNNNDNSLDFTINSYIYYGSSSGFYATPVELATTGARGSAIADLNQDGFLDIVFCSFEDGSTKNLNSLIYWGSASGFDTLPVTLLPTHGANGCVIFDYDGNGYEDIVFSNEWNDVSRIINSYIYLNSESGFSLTPVELATQGATGVSAGDMSAFGQNYYPEPVPEPITAILLAIGMLGLKKRFSR